MKNENIDYEGALKKISGKRSYNASESTCSD